jgi:hypothetical protein
MADSWNRWHTQSHMPDVIKQPGFLKASKYRRVNLEGDKIEYRTIYEMRDKKAFQDYDRSPVAKKLREDHKAKFGDSTRLERFVLERESEPVVA